MWRGWRGCVFEGEGMCVEGEGVKEESNQG